MNIDILFQVFLLLLALSYKTLIARGNIWGWILAATCALFSAFYWFLFFNLPILISLELCFMSLSIYGIYKHQIKIKTLTWIDFSIITLAVAAIIYFVFKQLETNTVWYEIVASAAFLSGVVFLAQKHSASKIIGWLTFIIGSACLIVVASDKKPEPAYVLILLHFISISISINAIKKLKKAPPS